MPSNEQRLYANELLNYLNADAQVANLEDALDDLEDNAKRKILSCVITYMYLYNHTAESMEQDEQEDFIDLFDLGRKTIKSLKQQTVDTYAVDTCGYEVKECRFHNCAWACQRLFGQAVVSNCQFVDCKGETLITSDYNAEIKVEDCEFSNIRLVEDGFTYYFRSMIVFSTVDTKFANAGRWSEVNRCIFNGICISRKSNRTPKSDEHAYVICAQVTSVDKFKFARARVADCTFTNCASVNSKLINTEPYDSLFGKKHNYMAVSSRNNSGLNDIGDPSSFVASSNVKLKETDANGNKIGSSLSVN